MAKATVKKTATSTKPAATSMRKTAAAAADDWGNAKALAKEQLAKNASFQGGTTIEEKGTWTGKLTQVRKVKLDNDTEKVVFTMQTEDLPDGENQGEIWAGPLSPEDVPAAKRTPEQEKGDAWVLATLGQLGVDIDNMKRSQLDGVIEELNEAGLEIRFASYESNSGFMNTAIRKVLGASGQTDGATEAEDAEAEAEPEAEAEEAEVEAEAEDEIGKGSSVRFKVAGELHSGTVVDDPEDGIARVKSDEDNKKYRVPVAKLELLAS